MAIAGRRRVPAGFTNVTYRTVGPIASIASQPELTVFRPEQPCLPFLPTRDDDGRWYALRTAVPPRLIAPVAPLRTVALGAASLRDRLCSAVSADPGRFYWAIAAVLPKTPR